MGALHMLVALATMALGSSLPKNSEGTSRSQNIILSGSERSSRQQKISEYFPDPRYPDEMVNPEFMTERCTSEGVFPHPYSCTWFYRCYDRIGRGFFHTAYFICEPGTVFDDDLDQCVDGISVYCDGKSDGADIFCTPQKSSCRSCQVGSQQQELCEFKECYSGGRPTGIERYCDKGQLYNVQRQICLEASDCPPSPCPNPTPNECPLNKLRPFAKWTDQDSGCSLITGCRNKKYYEEILCESFYDCESFYGCESRSKVRKACPDGYLFHRQSKQCINPPKDDCNIVDECSPSQGTGVNCRQHTGCLDGSTKETTQMLCESYKCGSKTNRCDGDLLFNPDTKTCQVKPPKCPPCTPDQGTEVQGTCSDQNVCLKDGTRITVPLCNLYTCSYSRFENFSCESGELFNPKTKECQQYYGCLICTPDQATEVLGSCEDYDVCQNDKSIKLKLCNLFTCGHENLNCSSNFGSGYFSFDSGPFFNPQTKKCQDIPETDELCGKFQKTCQFVDSSCKDYDLCKPQKPKQRLCSRASCPQKTLNGTQMITQMITQNACSGDNFVGKNDDGICVEKANVCLSSRPESWRPVIQPFGQVLPAASIGVRPPVSGSASTTDEYGEYAPPPRPLPVSGGAPPVSQIISQTTSRPLSTTIRPTAISTPISLLITDPVVISETLCTIIESSCQEYNVCYPIQRTQKLCEKESCYRDGQYIGVGSLCSIPGSAYDMETRQCGQKPSDDELCF